MGWFFSKTGSAAKTRVLVVDDDPITVETCAAQLVKLGYRAETATQPSAALDALSREMREIVLTDLVMKDMDGKSLLREIKRRWPSTDVILMSAYPNIADVIVAMKLGAYDFLIKPVTPDMLELTMKRCLEKRALQVDRNVEHSLRRRVEAHLERVKLLERERDEIIKTHGVPLMEAVERLKDPALTAHARALLDTLAKKLSA